MKLVLRGYGNPDYMQFVDIAPTMVVEVSDKEKALEVFQAYTTYWDMGGGNAGPMHGLVIGDDDEYLGYFSYNGRFWAADRELEGYEKTTEPIRIAAYREAVRRIEDGFTVHRLEEVLPVLKGEVKV